MTLYHRLLATHRIPWRVRNGFETWVEGPCRERHTSFYRWLHLGVAAEFLEPVTKGPLHHFFGYYDKSPWNRSGRQLLAHEAQFNDRAPSAEDRLGIGVIDRHKGGGFRRLTQTLSWNWQQGAMAQWLPAEPERQFSYNDRRNGQVVGVIFDVTDGEQAVLNRPIYAWLPDGSSGYSLNFARLAEHRPGYGYAGCEDPHRNDPHPVSDGIWRINPKSGSSDLIVSLDELAKKDPKASMHNAWHYVNHIQPSRGGARIAFFHLWHKDDSGWEVRLYTCRSDGSELSCWLDTGFISHYDWRDDDAILVWANQKSGPARFLLVGPPNLAPEVFAGETVKEDGHCSFSPNGRWVLNDTYPDRHQMRNLMLLDSASGRRRDIARLHSPKSRWWGELRCDLHPRWSRDGKAVCIDSVHEGTRQMYVVDVSRWVG